MVSVDTVVPFFGVAVPPPAFVPVLAGLLVLAHVVRRYRLQELTPSFSADTLLTAMTDPVVVERDGSVRFASEAVRETPGWPAGTPSSAEPGTWGRGREREAGSRPPADRSTARAHPRDTTPTKEDPCPT